MTRKFMVVAVSDASQAGTYYSHWLSGFIESIQYVKDDTTPYADGVDVTVTSDKTGEVIWTGTDVNASTVVRPRANTCSTAGVAALYAASGTAVTDKIAVSTDRVKIVLAQAGASKVGTFFITVSDD